MSKLYEALTKLYSPTGIRSGDSHQLPGFGQRSIHLYLPGREEGARVPHWRSPDPGVRGLPSRLSCRQRPKLQLLQQLHVKVRNQFVSFWLGAMHWHLRLAMRGISKAQPDKGRNLLSVISIVTHDGRSVLFDLVGVVCTEDFLNSKKYMVSQL